MTKDLLIDTTGRTSNDTEPYRSYWVDVRFSDAEEWKPLFTYSSLSGAQEVRDHWNGIKRLPNYHIAWFEGGEVLEARVRTVTVMVHIDPAP